MKVVETDGATLAGVVARVEGGEEVVLLRDGRPVAHVVAIPNGGRRRLGQWRGRVRVSDDFHAPLPDEDLALWSGE